ncbi:MAG: TonB-dependent receptor [Chitinophagaceae bacterium]|nr:TonB-dependent receptor [Chitinophagaceae bacterium]
MKKLSCFKSPPAGNRWLPTLLLMKLTALFILITTLQVSAKSYSQEKLDVNFKRTKLANALKEVERKTGYRFAFSNLVLSDNITVTVKAKDITVENLVGRMLENTGLSYVLMSNKLIAIKRQDAFYADITVRGRITDSEGKPLPDVSVTSGQKTGTTTNANGDFVITVDNDATLEFSYVGYSSQSFKVNGRTVINVVMVKAVADLSDVVIVGYGTTRKQDLTGAVSTIGKKELKNIPITRVDQMLQGKAAGVQVTSISGAPGTGTTIRIRGGNSINASNEPLYVIDGLIGGGDINLINPEDIESLVVLKDASSTAIYGARGANGVILVTTKKGVAGQDNINLDAYTGWQKVPKLIPMMNAMEYAELANESATDNGQPAPFSDPKSLGEGTNWQKEITRVAPMRNYTMGASGGNKGFNYYLSGNYSDQEGVIINSGFRRYQLRANVNKKVKDNLTIGVILNIGRAETDNNTVQLGGYNYQQSALAYPPTGKVYNDDGSFDSKRPNDPQVYDNPVAQGTLPVNKYTGSNIIGNIFAEWEFIKGLTFKSTFGSEMSFGKTNVYNPGTLPTRANAQQGGAASVNTSNAIMWLSENTLTYDKAIGSKHNITAVLGTSYQTGSTENLSANASLYATDVFTYNNLGATAQTAFRIGSEFSKYTISSYLSRINYSFEDKYLLTLTGRVDGSSRFAANNKYAFFPAVAVAWKVSKEGFMRNSALFSDLKFRASYGYNGNQAIGIYSSLPSLSTVSNYLIGGSNILGYTSQNLPNPNLKWETTGQLDIGVEFGVFNNRLNVEIDYYAKKTKDLLLSKQLPTQTGFYSTISNIGAVGNRGLELTISSRNIIAGDFTWETSFNVAGNRSKVLDLGGVTGFDLASTGFGANSTISRLVVGEPVGIFWGATYMGTQKTDVIPEGSVNPRATPRLGDPLYLDWDGDNKYSGADYHKIGDANPKFYGGLGNTFTYKKLSLNIFFQGASGNKVMSVSNGFYATNSPLTNQYKEMVNRWSSSNPDSDIPRVNSRDYVTSTRWVYDGSFLRLKSLSLSYALNGSDLNAKWIKRINIYATGTNLLLFTKYPFYDPETNSYGTNSTLRGFDYTNYPQNKTVVVGINLTL